MMTRQQEQERLFAEMPGTNHLSTVVQATEEQRRLLAAQADAQKLENDLHLAELFSRAGFFNGTKKAPKSPEQREEAKYEAFAKIRIGEEFGLKPAESMQAVYVDDFGNPGIEIHARVAKALATGMHRYEILAHDRSRCEIQWFRKEDGAWKACKPVACTVDQLKHVKIQGSDKTLGQKWNYQSYFEDMAYAWCQRRNVRRYAPETQGSFPIPPHEEEILEDAGVRVATPAEDATPEKVSAVIDDLAPERTDPTLPAPNGTEAPSTTAHEPAPEAIEPQDDVMGDPGGKSPDGDSEPPEEGPPIEDISEGERRELQAMSFPDTRITLARHLLDFSKRGQHFRQQHEEKRRMAQQKLIDIHVPAAALESSITTLAQILE